MLCNVMPALGTRRTQQARQSLQTPQVPHVGRVGPGKTEPQMIQVSRSRQVARLDKTAHTCVFVNTVKADGKDKTCIVDTYHTVKTDKTVRAGTVVTEDVTGSVDRKNTT
jgi:hypothetical protein